MLSKTITKERLLTRQDRALRRQSEAPLSLGEGLGVRSYEVQGLPFVSRAIGGEVLRSTRTTVQ